LAADDGRELAVYEAPVGRGVAAEVGVIDLRSAADDALSFDERGVEPVTVRGVDGWFEQDELFGATVRWEAGPERVVMVASRQLDRARLLAAVEAGSDDGGRGGFRPGPVAAGLGTPEPLGEPEALELFSLTPVPAGAVGHTVGYQSDDDLGSVVLLAVVSGDADAVAALRWVTAADTPVEVRGHQGWLGTRTFTTDDGTGVAGAEEATSGEAGGDTAGDGALIPDSAGDDAVDDAVDDAAEGDGASASVVESHAVIWREAPGVIGILVASGGFSADEVLGLTAGIEAATDDEWAALVDRADSPTPADAHASVAGDDGEVSWSVYLDDDGYLCGGVEGPTSGSETCGSLDRGGAEILAADDGRELAVYGVLPEGAVDVQAADGSSLGASTAPAEDGIVVYAITLDTGRTFDEVVFVDAAGREVGRSPVGSVPLTEGEPATTTP
ncbi:MAG TPA: hypothetical protein VIL36_02825, partial [Acidimicrobiales bacterium]